MPDKPLILTITPEIDQNGIVHNVFVVDDSIIFDDFDSISVHSPFSLKSPDPNLVKLNGMGHSDE